MYMEFLWGGAQRVNGKSLLNSKKHFLTLNLILTWGTCPVLPPPTPHPQLDTVLYVAWFYM